MAQAKTCGRARRRPGRWPGQGWRGCTAPRLSHHPGVHRCGISHLCPAGSVELLVDATRRLRRHAGDALELLLRRAEHLVDRAEMVEESPPARRTDPLEVVEDR